VLRELPPSPSVCPHFLPCCLCMTLFPFPPPTLSQRSATPLKGYTLLPLVVVEIRPFHGKSCTALPFPSIALLIVEVPLSPFQIGSLPVRKVVCLSCPLPPTPPALIPRFCLEVPLPFFHSRARLVTFPPFSRKLYRTFSINMGYFHSPRDLVRTLIFISRTEPFPFSRRCVFFRPLSLSCSHVKEPSSPIRVCVICAPFR